MHRLSQIASTVVGRLLRVLFFWGHEMPAGPNGKRLLCQRQASCMTLEMTRAWIFLAAPRTPGELASIIAIADSLNKSMPTRSELSDSLGWLRAAGLVDKNGSRFVRTAAGSQLVATCERGSKGASQVWDKVAANFRLRSIPHFKPEAIGEEELAMAIKANSKANATTVRKLGDKDA